ncbi:MAG: efflux RND transporter periplasmic adaptor subunit [Cellvibrio sp.]|uniref:efflux RND transporter periplasmic adaptor subunit n=1 Tax=Cellvibrio sp. TaxID=1965322 RepID=UPI002723439A|nr:efflux RND transporter periplasmic adaptor subunit [Cellvibrio sp.]
MAPKVIYATVAVLGIAAASGAAWWYQAKTPASTSVNFAVEGAPPGTGATGPTGAAKGATSSATAVRPPSVESAKVEVMSLTDDTQAVGSLKSRQGVTVRPEVSGRITQLNFRDGDRVRKGQLLVQFDDQLQVAQVKQSQAELSIALANHKRNQDLVAQNFISQRSVEESAANLEVARAKLALSQATAARLKIMAPFDGITGIRTVNVGDYLKDGGDIVNIEDITAVFVDFRLPERFQTKVKKGQQAQVDMDALPGRKFTAIIQAIDPLVDANGRSVGVRACIDNRQNQLRPGMFARVKAVFGERENAKVIPEEAIVPQGGKQYVIKLVDGGDKDIKKTQRVEVKVGIRRPGRVEILEGLSEGDEVVTAGQQRIQKDGTLVKVLELGRPAAQPPVAVGSSGSGVAGGVAASGTSVNTAPKLNPVGTKIGLTPVAKPLTGINPCLEGKS